MASYDDGLPFDPWLAEKETHVYHKELLRRLTQLQQEHLPYWNDYDYTVTRPDEALGIGDS